MSFPRYPKYADSGIEWLGPVPEHWEVRRLRLVAEIGPSKTEVSTLDREMCVSFLPMEAIGDDGSLSLERERTVAELESGYTYFREGDVTLAKITPCFENGKGAVMRGLLNGVGFGTTELIVARPRPSALLSDYLHYVFTSTPFRAIGESHMYGAGGQKRVPDSFVRDFTTALPPLDEQSCIVTVLDRETAKIDALIAEQKRLMELLQEKRQAVISHAVTKGLNPDAPMKPSGVEWLGDVPAHWDIKPLKQVARIDNAGSFGAEPGEENVPLPVATTAQIDKDGRFRVSEMPVRGFTHADVNRYVCSSGDILVVKSSGSVTNIISGKAGLVDDQNPRFVFSNFLMRVRCDHQVASPAFIYALLRSSLTRQRVELMCSTTTYPNLRIGEYVSSPLPIPPLEEQTSIMRCLSADCDKIDGLAVEASHAIDLLEERRKALISAAVTGQIDIRQHVAMESA